jgi:uncharacterized protein involved in exopolysaccharide biosynthesis
MTNRTSEPELFDNEQDPRAIGRFLRRMLHYWPAVLIALGLSALACSAFVYFRHPPFRSETVLLYSSGVSSADTSEESRSARSATARLKELLLSRPKLSQVVSAFGLYPDVQKKYGKEDAVEELKRHIEFKAPGGDTFSIAYTGGTPTEAQRVTQALAQIVIDGDAELRKSQAELSRDFLATEKTNKATELKNAEQRLAIFMGEHRRFALDATPLAAGAAIRATTAPAAATPAAGAGRFYVPQPRTSVQSSNATNPAPTTPAAPSPQAEERSRALAALAAARANLADQLRRFTPAHPDVRAAQGEVERATARLAALGPEPRPQPAAAPQPTPAAQEPAPARRSVSIPRPVATPAPAAGEKEDVVALETEWAKLTREVTAARQRLDQVEAALFKADVLANSERAGRAVQITVIDPAFLPERPLGLGLNVIIGIFLGVGLALGTLGAALAAAVDDHIYGGQDIVRVTEVLVQVPKLSWRRRAYAAE